MKLARPDFSSSSFFIDIEERVRLMLIQVSGGGLNLQRTLTKQERYLRSTYLSASEIRSLCEQLSFSVALLSGYRASSKQHKDSSRLEYITYQLENYILRHSMVLERALQFTNIAFQLGTPDAECKFSVVAKNFKVTPTKVHSALNRIKRVSSDFHRARNAISHQRGYWDLNDETYDVYLLDTVTRKHHEDREKFMYLAKLETDKYVESKKNKLNQQNKKVFQVVSDFFDSVHPIFSSLYQDLG